MKKQIAAFMMSLTIAFSSFASVCKGEDAVKNNYEDAEKAVITAWNILEDYADISSFNILFDDFEDLGNYIIYRNTEYFYVDIVSCSYNPENNIITKLNFEYIFDKAEIPDMRKEFEEKCKTIINLVPQNVTIEEKLLFLHDYIAENTSYDIRVFSNVDTSKDKYIRNAYGCIVNKKAVCEGISEAFIYLCKLIDVEAYIVTSTAMHHEWNMVKIGDNYYHIDVTQDAPVYNLGENGFHQAPGDITHTFFLKSDAQIKNEELGNSVHYSWEAPYAATDSETYKNAFWTTSQGIVNYYNGNYYFVSKGNFVKYNHTSNVTQNIFSIDQDLWYCTCGNVHRWRGAYSRAVLDTENKQVYFIASNNIYSYNVANGSISLVYSRLEKGFIYSIFLESGKLLVSVRDDDHNENPFYIDITVDLSVPDSSVVMGDANNDLSVNVADVLEIRKYLIKQNAEISVDAADVRYDKQIDTKDVLYLVKILSNGLV